MCVKVNDVFHVRVQKAPIGLGVWLGHTIFKLAMLWHSSKVLKKYLALD